MTEVAEYTFCETTKTGPLVFHIRRVGPEGISPAARGPIGSSLCGRDSLWDLTSVEPSVRVLDGFIARAQGIPDCLCTVCDAAFRAIAGAP